MTTERKPLEIQEVKTLLEQGLSPEQIGLRSGYAKRTVNEFIQKHCIRRGVPADNILSLGDYKASMMPPARERGESGRSGSEAEYYLRKRIQDLEGIVDVQKEEIGDLKEDNRELTRERNKLSRDLELAEERKQLDMQKLTLEHTYKQKSSLSGIMDAVSTNDKLGEVMVMVAQKVLGTPANNQSAQAANENIFSSAAANIINQCDEQKQAMLATVVEALASPDNQQTLNELFALATGQNQQ